MPRTLHKGLIRFAQALYFYRVRQFRKSVHHDELTHTLNFNVICSKRRLRSFDRPHQSAALGSVSSALPQNFSETWPHGGTEVSCIYWAGNWVFLYSLWRNVASELRRSAVFRGSGLALSRIWHASASLAIRSIKSSLRAQLRPVIPPCRDSHSHALVNPFQASFPSSTCMLLPAACFRWQ